MRLWHLFRKKRRIIFLLLLLSLFLSITQSYFDDNVKAYVKTKAMQIYEDNVTEDIKNSILENMSDNLMRLKYNDEGKVAYAYLDSYEALSIKAEASSLLSELNPKIESDINYLSVPVGYFFTKKFIFTDGLRVPIKLNIYQAFDSEIVTNVADYGINNQLYEISLQIKMNIYVQIPFQEQLINYEDNILLSSGIINNDIPNYYFYAS